MICIILKNKMENKKKKKSDYDKIIEELEKYEEGCPPTRLPEGDVSE